MCNVGAAIFIQIPNYVQKCFQLLKLWFKNVFETKKKHVNVILK